MTIYSSFIINRARAAVKTANHILGLDINNLDDEKVFKAASAIYGEYTHSFLSVFNSFCTVEEVESIRKAYDEFFNLKQEVLYKIYYLRNYPKVIDILTLTNILKQESCKLIVVDLYDGNLGQENLAEFCGALQVNRTLKHLEINKNNLGVLGIKEISKALVNTNIEYLNIGDNSLSYQGAECLAEILDKTSIKHLKIYTNNINIKGIKILAEVLGKHKLETLNLYDNNIGDEGIDYLAQAILKLKQNNTLCLTDLSVGNNNITAKGAYALANVFKQSFVKIRLDFSKNKFCEDLNFLSVLPATMKGLNLKSVSLRKMSVEKLTIELKRFHSLEALDIEDNKLDDKKIHKIIQNLPNSIIDLSLKNTGFGEESIIALARRTKAALANLRSLNIASNLLTDKIVTALANKLTEFTPNLEYLYLSDNKISDSCILSIVNWLEKTKIISVSFENNLITSASSEQLSKLVKIKSLRLLNLRKNNITKEVLECIHKSQEFSDNKLLSIQIDYNNLTSEAYEIYLNKIMTSYSDIYSFSGGNLVCSNVQHLASHIVENKNRLISLLNIEKSRITLEGIKILTTNLVLTKLIRLTVDNNNLGDDAARELINNLANTMLLYLNISSNNLSDKVGILLAYILPKTNIMYLNTENNNFGAGTGKVLALNLPKSKVITLNLNNNQLGPQGIEELASGLPNSKIKDIDLRKNMILKEGVYYLAKQISGCKYLEYLYLQENNIGDQGATYLSEGLKRNSTIISLDVSKNDISDKGIVALIEIVPTTNIARFSSYNNNYSRGVFDKITNLLIQEKLNNKCFSFRDDHYSWLTLNKKVNYGKLIVKNSINSNNKLLIFLAAPSCSGKSVFTRFLNDNNLLTNTIIISTDSFQDLPGYHTYKSQGVRHPELERDIYDLFKNKRFELISKELSSGKTVFVETHLNDSEAIELSKLSEYAKISGYWTGIIGLAIHPYKLFQNAKKSNQSNINIMLNELKEFNGLLERLLFLDYKLLIDFNAEIDNKEIPFLISIKSGSYDLIFNSDALKRFNNNINMDVENLSLEYKNFFSGRNIENISWKLISHEDINFLLKDVADLTSEDRPEFIKNLISYLIPSKLSIYINEFKSIKVDSGIEENNQPNSGMIFIIRHAESEANILEAQNSYGFSDDKNVNLTKKGYMQAVILSEYMQYICSLRKRNVRIFYSPTLRTVETMNVLLSRIGRYIKASKEYECLRERSAGLFQGLTSQARNQLFSLQNSFFEYQKANNKFYASMPGGESPNDVEFRLNDFVRECKNILYNNADEDIIIVTHAKTSLLLRKVFCKKDEAWYNNQNDPNNVSVCMISKMPKMTLSETEIKDLCSQLFIKYITNYEPFIFNIVSFIASCLGYLTSVEVSAKKSGIPVNEKYKQLLIECLRLNQDTYEQEKLSFSSVANISMFGIRFIQEMLHNGFQRRPKELEFQGFELFDSRLFDIIHKDDMQTFLEQDILESSILPFSLNHQRYKADFSEQIFFGNYFAKESAEIRRSAHIARKGEDAAGKKCLLNEQFYHADIWINYMLNINKGALVDKIILALTNSKYQSNPVLTIAYPAGESGASSNVIGIVFAEILKKKLIDAIIYLKIYNLKTLSIITMPITQLTKTSRSGLDPFEKAIYRTYFNVSKIQGKALLVDDDATTGASISEMVSACRRRGIDVIGCAVAAIVPGCEILPIQEVVKNTLENALRKRYNVSKDKIGPDDPVELYNSLLKGFGLCDGIDSLSNMMSIFQIAALYEPAEARAIVEKVWNDATQSITKISFQEICDIFNNDIKLFPILGQIEKPALTTNKILDFLRDKANHWNRIKDGLESKKDCPRKFMNKLPRGSEVESPSQETINPESSGESDIHNQEIASPEYKVNQEHNLKTEPSRRSGVAINMPFFNKAREPTPKKQTEQVSDFLVKQAITIPLPEYKPTPKNTFRNDQ